MHSREIQGAFRLGFSLLELMIVIAIISLAYLLVFSTMKKSIEKPKALQISNIKSILKEQGMEYEEVEIFCIQKSESCYLYRDSETSKYEEEVALGDVTAYHMDEYDELKEIDFGRFQDYPVSLRFKLHHNGSSSQLVVKNKSGIYYLPAMFGSPSRVESLEDAKKLWMANREQLSDSGEYYK